MWCRLPSSWEERWALTQSSYLAVICSRWSRMKERTAREKESERAAAELLEAPAFVLAEVVVEAPAVQGRVAVETLAMEGTPQIGIRLLGGRAGRLPTEEEATGAKNFFCQPRRGFWGAKNGKNNKKTSRAQITRDEAKK